ncbi:uncharacterized protein LOC128297645 [Anopheles moucheti]|uniref:uncharacterized protein LOC128297645 n=1 Tax=Anopheles moucheti TaxID=186751 RepID=UPI0022F14211|nr:uncharacterized protein LOC128297645 [Anopheles moucheti]
MYRALAFICALGVCVSYVLATQCPTCVGVQACHSNQTVPKVTCTAAVVNQTVIQLSAYFKNVSEFAATASKYSCVKANFKPSGAVNYTFAVQGCTTGNKNVCLQPTYEFNGNLSCSYKNGGHKLHNLAQSPFTGALLSVVILIGTLMMSS